jgi:hypothetical protein
MKSKEGPMEIITKCVLTYNEDANCDIKIDPDNEMIVFIENAAIVQISKRKSNYKTRIKLYNLDPSNDLIILGPDRHEHNIEKMSSKRRIDYAPGEITDIMRSY